MVAPIIRYMDLGCTTTCTDDGIEPLHHSARSEATNHLVHQHTTNNINYFLASREDGRFDEDSK